MGVTETDYDGINALGQNILDGAYKSPLVFADMPVTENVFKDLVTTSFNATAAAKHGGTLAITLRNNASKKLYNCIKIKILAYLNDKFAGEKAMFELAGTNVSADPTPVPPPDQPKISKVVRGSESGTVKVVLVRGKNSKLKKRSRTDYRVFMFAKPDDKTGKEIGDSTDSRFLFGYDVPEDTYVWIAVRAKNSGGSSLMSDKVKFFLASE